MSWDGTNARGSEVVDDYPYQVAGHSDGKAIMSRMLSEICLINEIYNQPIALKGSVFILTVSLMISFFDYLNGEQT